MNTGKENIKWVFKYNMSFYYQSTIIYFIVFIFYVVIRGEFIENSYKLMTRDPIIYSFLIIVTVSVVSLVYNLYINRYLEITQEKISFINRFAVKSFQFDQILEIKISYPRQRQTNRAFRLIRIKLKYRRRPVIIRPYDYENEEELINKLTELNEKLGNN